MRLCDFCGKNQAVVSVKRLDKEGRVVEVLICAECARKKGFSDVEKSPPDTSHLPKTGRKDKVELVCSNCGMSWVEFKRQGRLGCAKCYTAFKEELPGLIRRLHGSVQHLGKSKSQGRKRAQEKLLVERLRAELTQAIAAEDYERAAALRDRLRRSGDEPLS